MFQGTFSYVWRHFWLPQLGSAVGIYWEEARNSAKQHTGHNSTPETQIYLTSNDNNVQIETS